MQNSKPQHCLIRIRSHYPVFSEKEKKIADYILANPEKIIHGTINQIAHGLSIADSTVFRFCKRLGFSGYQAMKIALATELVEPIQDIHEKIEETDNEITVANKVFQSNAKTIEDTFKFLDEDVFRSAVKAILHARRVEFFGNGGSNSIAIDAYHKFVRTGIPVFSQIDSHLQLMSASQMTQGDVAVLISHTGTTRDILDILNTVKENGVTTIAVTSFAKSPLSEQVDLALYTIADETDFRSEALASRIAQLSLMDAIYVNILKAQKDEGQQSLKKVRKAIAVKRI